MKRRIFLQSAALAGGALSSLSSLLAWAASGEKIKLIGGPEPFNYAWLKGLARTLATQPYQSYAAKLPASLQNLTWDQYQQLQYQRDHALWGDRDSNFRAQFFHLGLYFKTPVRMYKVSNGQAQEIAYDPAMFTYGKSGVEPSKLPKDLGFAGFRLNYHSDWTRDVAAFLGASYFRAVGGEMQYGLSARGLAIDTAMPRPEEFPEFVRFWLEQPADNSQSLVVYALLDSSSTSGAYRFTITPGDTLVMDMDVALYPRKPIERLGIAPITSMYMVGENDRRANWDWRPEIHDADGLAIWTGNGEWIWRPLNNPRQMRFNAYDDNNLHGFGLLQRDRNFDHYQDDGAFYDKRPSLWVEPKDAWGKGSVQLVEIPTLDETFDNVVAFWNPKELVKPGQEYLYSYRLYWSGLPPVHTPLAYVVATRSGLGGVVGRRRNYFSWRFTVDFIGGKLALLGKDAKLEAVVTSSRGRVELLSCRPQLHIGGYRAQFDIVPLDVKQDPIDIRLFLKLGKEAMSETWLYQWNPPPANERDLRNPGHL
ncbi:glucan biosynthesis protein [Nitrosococcus wardiae]|uniref:Glucans biosynthesis protein D n=1 Tax=Nitrosococcus wardiae TaxID=1814290 RepID=A0A4P7BXL3_9GAMM|nr:glucan biosynthesis protein D [Nitrosococcus wardiae]QBQ53929.1 glucan biosynthesis protein D [Nitrosococcus wardiae]